MNWRRFFRRDEADAEQGEELDLYLDITTEEYIERGMEPRKARAAARRKLGNTTLIRATIYLTNQVGWRHTTFMALPTTLQEAIVYFADSENANAFLADLRWTDGKVRCPNCGSDNITYLASVNRYKCYEKHPRAQFSLKVGTIFEDSPISLDKWLCAIWLIVNCKNGISSCEMARDLGITQKSAWFLDHRIRFALRSGSLEQLSGHVEADETFIGGKARNMHIAKRQRRITGTGGKDKTAVMGILERGGKSAYCCCSEPEKESPSG